MIKATTVYDRKVNEELLKFNLISNPFKWVIYLVATVSGVILCILNAGSDFFTISVLILISSIALDLVIVYYYFISPKLKLKRFKDSDAVTNYIEFEDKAIHIKSKYNGKKESNTIPYEKIYKLCEGPTAFYFFVDKYNTLIVNKDGIEGSISDLKAFLMQKVDGKRNKLK